MSSIKREGFKRVLIAGDSTAAHYQAKHYPMMGWGQALGYFAAPDVEVLNFAQGGRSTKSFREEGHFDALLKATSEGSLVFLQFGHNDQKGNEPEIYVPLDGFRANLLRMVCEVRAMKGLPVLLTSFPRCVFGVDGQLANTHGEYPQATRDAAAESSCPLIDVNKLAHARFANPLDAYKHYAYPAPGGHGFVAGRQDISHFNIFGAHEMAKLVVEEFLRLHLDSFGWFGK